MTPQYVERLVTGYSCVNRMQQGGKDWPVPLPCVHCLPKAAWENAQKAFLLPDTLIPACCTVPEVLDVICLVD